MSKYIDFTIKNYEKLARNLERIERHVDYMSKVNQYVTRGQTGGALSNNIINALKINDKIKSITDKDIVKTDGVTINKKKDDIFIVSKIEGDNITFTRSSDTNLILTKEDLRNNRNEFALESSVTPSGASTGASSSASTGASSGASTGAPIGTPLGVNGVEIGAVYTEGGNNFYIKQPIIKDGEPPKNTTPWLILDITGDPKRATGDFTTDDLAAKLKPTVIVPSEKIEAAEQKLAREYLNIDEKALIKGYSPIKGVNSVQVTGIKSKLQELLVQVGDGARIISDLGDQIRALESQLEAARRELEAAKDSGTSSQEQINELQDDVAILRGLLDKANSELETANTAFSQIDDQMRRASTV